MMGTGARLASLAQGSGRAIAVAVVLTLVLAGVSLAGVHLLV